MKVYFKNACQITTVDLANYTVIEISYVKISPIYVISP